ncbi:MAG: amino acid adenylation domain-containing protein [Cyanobacteria bacterium]|jgi:amino acid adenylation domain-containing protein/thioester reductase-like protein|nr:amino acid adenylation domain-containing protein [Cyanobacteria bacterium GSL.Bin1]
MDHQKQNQSTSNREKLIQDLLNKKGIKTNQRNIPKRKQEETCHLSFSQKRIWFIHKLAPQNALYNLFVAYKIKGKLDVAALNNSFNAIIKRHEILRTSFQETEDGTPIQVVLPNRYLTIPIIDLTHIDAKKQEKEIQDLVTKESLRPFDLTKDNLLRLTLIQLTETEHILFVAMHHIVSDGWSMGIFMQEIATLYQSFSSNTQSELSDLSIQYADFAIWQQRKFEQGELEKQLSYWKQQFQDIPPVLELPNDHPRPPIQTARGATESFRLSQSLTQALETLSQQEHVTLFMTLLAAFKALLYRYTSQTDIVVGSPIANRSEPELENLIGFFVNTLAFRTQLSENMSFRELLASVRDSTIGAYDNQDLPFEKLVEELKPERNLSRHPLFQVMFVFQNFPNQQFSVPGLTVSTFETNRQVAKFDLTLSISKTERGLAGSFQYNIDLFNHSTIQQLVKHFQVLIEDIAFNPDQQLSNLSLLTQRERHQLLVEWNNTDIKFPQYKCIHQLFEEQVEQTPDAIALVHHNQQLTYQELNVKANQLAHDLQGLGVQPETLVGICMEQCLERIIGLLAILKAGGAYVPLDPTYPKERIHRICHEANVVLLLTQSHLSQEQSEVVSSNLMLLDQQEQTLTQQPRDNPINSPSLEQLAYVIYTSGSTGQPKGVSICQRGLLNLVFWHQSSFGVTAATRATQLASIAFDASAWEIWPYLTAGASLYLVDRELLNAPVQLQNWLLSRGIEIAFVPTPLAESFFSLSWSQQVALRTLLTGGDRLNQFPPSSLPFQLVNNYGPTENTVVTTSGTITPHADQEHLPSMGSPIDNTNLYVLDRNLQSVPIGVPGELYISSVGLARGYCHRPGLTAETFLPNPFSETAGVRLYRTGDLVRYRSESRIEFLGRIDNQIKLRGFRIERGEIESTLNLHPKIVQSTVTLWDKAGNQQLVAYVVPQLEASLTSQELQSFLKEKLPSYMIPVAFILLDEFPLTPNGKVNHRALPDPGTTQLEPSNTFVAPRNALERELCDIWCQILALEQVGIHDNFFDLGGHSLLITQLLAQVRNVLQVDLPLRSLLEAPTVAELTNKIELAQDKKASVETYLDPAEYLRNDVVLDPDIYPQSQNIESEPTNILLTGATGFLGAFLLKELLQQTGANIYCLVRASHAEAGQQKIQTSLQSYSIGDESLSSRIIPLVGDLSKPLCGLSQQQFAAIASKIDVIYHNGAWVHHAYPYSTLKAANVSGTQEILRLASRIKTKPVHFISTVSVFSPNNTSGVELVREQDNPDQGSVPASGYGQSKWVAEQLIAIAQQRGIPTCIYRPGRISGDSEMGVFNENDFLYRLIIGCIQLGMAPAGEMKLNLAPVNYVSRALVYLSQQNTSYGKAFHLINPSSFNTSQLIEYLHTLGYSIQQVPYEQWRAQLLEIAGDSPDHPLYPLVPLFPRKETQPTGKAHLQFDYRNVEEALANTTITCPAIADSVLPIYVSHLIDRGFIKPPQPPLQKIT